MENIRIIFMDVPANAPLHMVDYDGQYSLDIFKDTKLAISRVIDDYVNVGTIKQDTFKQLDIPMTKKNRFLLGQTGNPSALNQNNNLVYDIQLLKGDFTYPVQGLQLVETIDKDETFSCTIFGELNDWYRPMRELFLDTIELGSDIVDYTWLVNQANHWRMDDNESPVFPPLVNYGKWYIQSNLESNSQASSQVVFNNFRLWHSAYAVLRQAFCQLGYKLIAPSMDTEKFRRYFCYLLDPEFETANQLDVANRPFVAQRPSDLELTSVFATSPVGRQNDGVVNMGFSPVSDPGNHYFTRPTGSGFPIERFYGSFYSGGIIGNFTFKGTIRFQPTNAASLIIPISPNYITLIVSIKKSPKFGFDGQSQLLAKSKTLATRKYEYKSAFVNGLIQDFDFDLSTESIKVYQHEVVYIQIELAADMVNTSGQTLDRNFLLADMKLLQGSEFKNNVSLQVIEEGDTIEFGKLLHKQKTALDFLLGIAHLYNYKIETDSIAKTVSMYSEFKVDFGDEGIQEAFFKENQDDVYEATDKIQVKSMVQRFLNTDLGRDVYLKFLDSTDGFILSKNLTDELHSKRIDLGPQYNESENVIQNPFFEPMANGIDAELGGLTIVIGPLTGESSSNYIPFMWESQSTEDGVYPDVGFDYEPRIAIAYPPSDAIQLSPLLTGKDDLTESKYVYEDLRQIFINPFGQIFPDGAKRRAASFIFDMEETLVYGSDSVNSMLPDLYSLIYERSINQAYFGILLEFLVMIDLVDFANLSFRRKWHIKYKSGAWGEIDFYARLSRLNDFVINGNLTTPAQLIPDNNNFTNC